MSVTTDQYRRAVHLAEAGAPPLLAAIRRDKRGRRTLDPKILFVGMYLSVDVYSMATVNSIYKVLSEDLPRELQWDLDFRTGTAHKSTLISIRRFYKLTSRISDQLDYTKARAANLTDAQRHQRRDRLDHISATITGSTLQPRPEGSNDYALDGTGIWASERAPKRTTDIPDLACDEENLTQSPPVGPADDPEEPEPTDPPAPARKRQGDKGPSDARWGHKTKPNGGGRELYYGYDVEALIRVAGRDQRGRERCEPALVERIVVLPAGTDIVEPCLRLFDKVVASGGRINDLLVDRHYSYKEYDRWAVELMKRRIRQVVDLRADDHGFADWNGMKVAAGWHHCPGTPSTMAVIKAPEPHAPAEKLEAFFHAIEQRRPYAARYVERLGPDGKLKVQCPALAGTVGCPLREHTVTAAHGLGKPVVANPPTGGPLPAICAQKTVDLQITMKDQKIAMKLAQEHYWGSRKWHRSYARRTYVEGWFGVLKSPTATGNDDGSHQFRGMPMVTLVLAVAAAVTNVRLLRKWHEDGARPASDNPYLAPDQPFHGFAELTKEQAAEVDKRGAAAQRARKEAQWR